MIKANSLFNNKFCFNINFEDIIERLSITCSVKKKMTSGFANFIDEWSHCDFCFTNFGVI